MINDFAMALSPSLVSEDAALPYSTTRKEFPRELADQTTQL